MANKAIALFGTNYSILLIEQSGGGYALAVKQVTASTPMAAGDKSIPLSAFGTNLSIRLVRNADGVTYSLAVATAVNPKPAADQVVALFGTNESFRLVALSGGDYALAVVAQ